MSLCNQVKGGKYIELLLLPTCQRIDGTNVSTSSQHRPTFGGDNTTEFCGQFSAQLDDSDNRTSSRQLSDLEDPEDYESRIPPSSHDVSLLNERGTEIKGGEVGNDDEADR